MNHLTSTLLRSFAGCALFAGLCLPAQAQDKALLDLLVKRGTITQAEADTVAKQYASMPVVSPRDSNTKALRITGMLQVQYAWQNTEDSTPGAPNPPSSNQFLIRRAYLGAIADLGNGWGGEILMDFAAGANPSGQIGATQNLFEKAVITKVVEGYGLASIGYQKVQFVREQNTPTSQVLPVERSIVTNFFNNPWGSGPGNGANSGSVGFGNRYAGLFWEGTVSEAPGVYYGVSLNNGVQSVTAFGAVGASGASYNQFSFWANAGYKGKFQDFNYDVGMNMGYSGDGNDDSFGPGLNQSNTVWGLNPYFTVGAANFTVTAEFVLTQIENGRSGTPGSFAAAAFANSSRATPYGFNITPSYKITDQWEAVARFSWLSTNGRGTSISNVQFNAPNVVTGLGPTALYDDVWSLYAGFNYYIIGNSLRLAFGYEYAQFSDSTPSGGPVAGPAFTGSGATVNSVRAQLQILF